MKSYDKDGIPHRREIPENSDAIAVVGFDWETVNRLLSNLINDLAPIRDPKTAWIVRATQDGLHIDFYDDRRDFEQRLYEDTLKPGPQVHAGTLKWW